MRRWTTLACPISSPSSRTSACTPPSALSKVSSETPSKVSPSGSGWRPARRPRGRRCGRCAARSCPGRLGDQAVLVAGLVEVVVDLPQARELESFAQLGDGEGAERDRVLVRLDPGAVLEDERDVGDVL